MKPRYQFWTRIRKEASIGDITGSIRIVSTSLVVFDYQLGRGREGPVEMLKDFYGTLQTDAYSAYNSIVDTNNITLMLCRAHAGIYFADAIYSDRERTE